MGGSRLWPAGPLGHAGLHCSAPVPYPLTLPPSTPLRSSAGDPKSPQRGAASMARHTELASAGGGDEWPGDWVPLTVFFLGPCWGWALLAILLQLLFLQDKERQGQSVPGHHVTVPSGILSLGCLNLSQSSLTPGHPRRSGVPQHCGGQKRVTTSVRWGSGGQNVGREEGQPDHTEHRRLSFERVRGGCEGATVNGVGTV